MVGFGGLIPCFWEDLTASAHMFHIVGSNVRKEQCYLAPSSSGPGRQVLILKIRGSTPLGVTKKQPTIKVGYFYDQGQLLKFSCNTFR
jgi:hypothetical protein